jgi:hypothetical protein
MLLHLPGITARNPLHVVGHALAHGVARLIERWTEPKPDPIARFFSSASIALPAITQLLKPPVPLDVDGRNVKQIRRELAAEEARLDAEHAEKRARLIADFGPKFLEAFEADDEAVAHEDF